MDGAIVQYLKELYNESETPGDGPKAKRVKFSDIQESISQRFPNALLSSHHSSLLVKQAFPNSRTKRLFKERQTFIFGIYPATPEPVPEIQKARPTLEDLQEENRLLRKKVTELEAEVRGHEDQAQSTFSLELDNLLRHGKFTLNGPDIFQLWPHHNSYYHSHVMLSLLHQTVFSPSIV